MSVSVSFSGVHCRSDGIPSGDGPASLTTMNAGERSCAQPTTPPPQLESVIASCGHGAAGSAGCFQTGREARADESRHRCASHQSVLSLPLVPYRGRQHSKQGDREYTAAAATAAPG